MPFFSMNCIICTLYINDWNHRPIVIKSMLKKREKQSKSLCICYFIDDPALHFKCYKVLTHYITKIKLIRFF